MVSVVVVTDVESAGLVPVLGASVVELEPAESVESPDADGSVTGVASVDAGVAPESVLAGDVVPPGSTASLGSEVEEGVVSVGSEAVCVSTSGVSPVVVAVCDESVAAPAAASADGSVGLDGDGVAAAGAGGGGADSAGEPATGEGVGATPGGPTESTAVPAGWLTDACDGGAGSAPTPSTVVPAAAATAVTPGGTEPTVSTTAGTSAKGPEVPAPPVVGAAAPPVVGSMAGRDAAPAPLGSLVTGEAVAGAAGGGFCVGAGVATEECAGCLATSEKWSLTTGTRREADFVRPAAGSVVTGATD